MGLVPAPAPLSKVIRHRRMFPQQLNKVRPERPERSSKSNSSPNSQTPLVRPNYVFWTTLLQLQRLNAPHPSNLVMP